MQQKKLKKAASEKKLEYFDQSRVFNHIYIYIEEVYLNSLSHVFFWSWIFLFLVAEKYCFLQKDSIYVP